MHNSSRTLCNKKLKPLAHHHHQHSNHSHHNQLKQIMPCNCAFRCECVISSIRMDTIGAAPEYLQRDAIRWNSAAQIYEELQKNESVQRKFRKKCRSQYHSPERSPAHRRLSHNHLLFGGSLLEMTTQQNGHRPQPRQRQNNS